MIPLACGMGLCSNNCSTHKGGVSLFPHIHTKQKQKEQFKLKTPKKIFKKPKEGKKKPARKNRDN